MGAEDDISTHPFDKDELLHNIPPGKKNIARYCEEIAIDELTSLSPVRYLLSVSRIAQYESIPFAKVPK
jgi:hypothetical protein